MIVNPKSIKSFFLKLSIQLAVLLLFVAILHLEYGNETEKAKKSLYNNIPDIKAYNSDNLLKDSIIISARGRSPTALGFERFIIPESSSGVMVIEYYKKALSGYDWKEKEKEEIIDKFDNHCGDRFVFQKGEYKIKFEVYPPLGNECHRVQSTSYHVNPASYYIYVTKSENRLLKDKKD